MTHLELAKDLYKMVDSGQMMEAVEKYYADDCVIIEATGETRNGKEAQKQGLVQWQNSLEQYHGGGTYSITANEDSGVTMVESWADLTFKGGGPQVKFEEVAVQHWKDGKIVRERFYYNAPNDPSA